MKNVVRGILISFALVASVFAAGADLAQVVHIAVEVGGKIQVEGKQASLATLTATLSSTVQDKDHTAVEIRVSAGTKPAELEQVKDACRRAGLSKFVLVTKP